jgi:hypothetical protein
MLYPAELRDQYLISNCVPPESRPSRLEIGMLYPAELRDRLSLFGKATLCKKGQRGKPSWPFLSGWQDSNLRPPRPKRGAITGLRYTPQNFGIQYLQLYQGSHPNILWRREGDSNPRYGHPYTCLANMRFQPLTHLSNV